MRNGKLDLVRNRLVGNVVLFAISLLTFSIVFITREIAFLKTISVLARYNTSRFLPVIAILLLMALSLSEQRISAIVTAAILFPIFALTLNGLWAGAYSENYVLSGLLPRSDAFGFYTGSISLLENGVLSSSMGTRRPLFAGFLSFILWITGGNLQITLGVLTYLIASACFFSVLEVRKTLNPVAVVVFFIIEFLFIRRFIGITMSEIMGFILGVSSFTCFLISLRKINLKTNAQVFIFIFATLLYALSQAARPGAVAFLALLIIFSGWLWREKEKISWKWMLVTLIIVIVGFMLNTLIFSQTTPEDSVQMNNIGFGIYGLATGGKGWKQIFIDHPEILTLPPGIHEQRIIQIIIQTIKANPLDYLKGLMVQFKTLFSFQSTNSLFSFIWSSNQIFNYVLITLFLSLFTIGIIAAFYDLKRPFNQFILLLTFGFFLSLPFAPAYQTQYMRVYAASIPLLAILPAFGIHALIHLLPKKLQKFLDADQLIETTLPSNTLFFSIVLTLFILSGPLLVRYLAPKEIPEVLGCPHSEKEVVLRYYPGSRINIFKNTPDIMTWVPNITQLDYKGSIHNICCEDEIIYFENIPAPNTLYPTLNLLNNKAMYMITDGSLLPDKKALLHICGRIEDIHGKDSEHGFLYPQTITIIG